MKNYKDVSKGIAMISQIGFTMITPIALCSFIGYQLDKKLSTDYWFIIFLILGFLTAFRNVYHITRQFYAKDKAREDEELEYLASLRRQSCEKNNKQPKNGYK